MRFHFYAPGSLAAVALILVVGNSGNAAPLAAAPSAGFFAAPAIILAGNGVTAARALRRSKHKWTQREQRKGYWQECGYDGYCTTIYN